MKKGFMKIKRKYFIVLFLAVTVFLLLFYILRINSYTEFQPIIFEDNSYKYYELLQRDRSFNENLKIVLDYNKADYKVDNRGRVLIRRSLSEDKELLFNYTKKALDSLWVGSHKVLNK